jgi:outer membrane protein OmpA-like peptidoglycan-associated protein
MFFPKLAAAISAACFLILPSVALAQTGTLVLVMGGEAYDGPPKFSVSFDGKPLGEGAVAKAIDTAAGKRFADVPDKADYVESFSFEVPEADFSPNGDIRIRLTNEAFGGEGSNRDRNLYVSSVSLNGTEIKAPALVTNSTAGIKPNTMIEDYLVLTDGSVEAVALAPTGGWTKADAGAAKAKPVETPSAPDAAAAVLAPVTEKSFQDAAKAAAESTEASAAAPVAEAPVASPKLPTEPAVASTETPAAAPVAKAPVVSPKPATEPEKAAARTEAPGSGTCAFDEAVHIIGFNENSNDLTKRVMDQLDKIAQAIGKQRCSILLTGYSSTQGSYSVNALFAVERAQNALKYLRDSGVRFKSAQATGAGETSQFGENFRANRRVVVTVMP